MNAKKHPKHRRRAPKLNPKLDRGSQHRRAEGKSNIGTKRVTLLPGFLINGYTSGTAKKTKGRDAHKTKDDLLTENLQSFLERKGNLRRSQRILKKHNGENATSSSKSPSSDPCPDISSSTPHLYQNNHSFKSILKKNPKSIFKEISDRFSKVHMQRNMEEDNTHMPERNINDVGDGQNRPLTKVDNRFICQDFAKKIRVTFKKNATQECQENIKRDIGIANAILEGKVRREETMLHEAEDDAHEKDTVDALPVPVRNWIYSTPENQKISAPQLEECQLQPGVIFANNNRHNVYEINTLSHTDMFFKKVAEIKKTPANFGRQTDMHRVPNGFQAPWSDHPHPPCTAVGHGRCSQQVPFEPCNPNIISRPLKTTMPILASFLENKISNQIMSGNDNNPDDSAHDFTFIQEGNEFKMQQSQPAALRTKRRLSDDADFIGKNMNFNLVKCERPSRMFNFNTQERNMFDFSIIM